MNHSERSHDHLLFQFGKRGFDVVVAAVGLLLTLPLSVGVALAIVIDDGRPILHRGWRVGRDGRIFKIYKFRSMVAQLRQTGGVITTAGDRRVTPVGRFIRRTKLDELPQLFNVLRGDMSLVGPRPEHPNYVRLYTLEQRRVLSVRPGITGAASVRYPNEEQLLRGDDPEALYRTVVMPEKLRIELEYLERRSFWGDLRLIAATALAVPRRATPVELAVNGHAVSHPASARTAPRSR
ncbi:MAG TPA: sugar transferase [Candidatus Dormibacteraeota bacterium]|nr:sugar transferase [Candidatus Dormibacteraeota bacterium]